MRKNSSSPLGLYTIGIAALFLVGFLLLVVFGAGEYRDTVDTREANLEDRAVLSYLSTSVQQTERGLVSVAEGPDGPMLVLAESDSEYVTRIYLHDGELTEEYRRASYAPDPSQGRSIAKTKTFELEEASKDLWRATTDQGEILLFLPGTSDKGTSGLAGKEVR